jgi:hypothetical protein
MKTRDLLEKILPLAQPVADYLKAADPETFVRLRKKVGASGHTESSHVMMEQINAKFPNFQNQGLTKYMEDKKSQSNEKARQIVPKIQLMIADKVIASVKARYGDAEEEWWVNGVPHEVRKNAAKTREDNPARPPLEKCLMLIDYKMIILDNWDILGPYFSRGEGKKEKQVSWMNELNKIRNKVAHPETGIVTAEELEFLNEILEWLEAKSGQT